MKPVPLEQWDESLSYVIDDMNGCPLNVHSLMANHPDLLNAWWEFRNYAVRGGELTQRDCELVILRVAVHLRSWYEWASHVDRGLASGLSLEEIERVTQGPGAAEWSFRDTLLLQSVDELIAKSAITATTREQMADHFSDKQLMDIIAIHGMYTTLGCMINTWGLQLDEHIRTRLPESVRALDFETNLASREQ